METIITLLPHIFYSTLSLIIDDPFLKYDEDGYPIEEDELDEYGEKMLDEDLDDLYDEDLIPLSGEEL